MMRRTLLRGGLTIDNMNAAIKRAEYAVRGPIINTANELKAAGRKITYCNIGNPQQLGQPPLTFPREVLALLSAPHLLSKPSNELTQLFSEESVDRARSMNPLIEGSGAYTHSQGLEFVRHNVAAFIAARDNGASGSELGPAGDIFLTNGASPAVQYALSMCVNGTSDGVMIPRPQYPLYSATLTCLEGTAIPYLLDEERNWAMSAEMLASAYDSAKAKGVTPRAVVIINPGNPTGQVLGVDTMQAVIQFCVDKDIILLADEVYQANIYTPTKKFHSFREILLSKCPEHAKKLQLISFHSTSKGLLGECGRRGGYMELTNFSKDLLEQFVKCASIDLCPNLGGQFMTDLLVKGPPPASAAGKRHAAENEKIFSSLKRRATVLVDKLNKIPGLACNPVEGAMYAFPSLTLPGTFKDEAKKAVVGDKTGVPPDMLWCLGLLQRHGIAVVPGSGFGQKEGTWHFRTTILPPEENFEWMTQAIADHHAAISNPRWTWTAYLEEAKVVNAAKKS